MKRQLLVTCIGYFLLGTWISHARVEAAGKPRGMQSGSSQNGGCGQGGQDGGPTSRPDGPPPPPPDDDNGPPPPPPPGDGNGPPPPPPPPQN